MTLAIPIGLCLLWSAILTWQGLKLRNASRRHSMAIHLLATGQSKNLTVEVPRQPLKTIRWTRSQMWKWAQGERNA